MRQDYSEEALNYDQKRFEDRKGQFHARCDAEILRSLVKKSGAKFCLDVPVGSGRVLTYLENEPVKIVGCDYTPSMLKIAKSRNQSNAIGLVHGDASRLPFPTDSFELIICVNFFHLFPSHLRSSFVEEFKRILKPGGYFICSFTNGWYGGGLNWIRHKASKIPIFKTVVGDCGVYFLMPSEIAQLFPQWKVLAHRGNFLPLQRHISFLSQKTEKFMIELTGHFPFNELCFTHFFLLQSDK